MSVKNEKLHQLFENNREDCPSGSLQIKNLFIQDNPVSLVLAENLAYRDGFVLILRTNMKERKDYI